MNQAIETDRSPVRLARRMAVAAYVGTALEAYDYFLYGTAASIVFNRLYFTSHDPAVATLAAFASFSIGFVARPVGAALFGHVGDRLGRRRTLLVTVSMIGIVTGLVGLLPDFASIGVAAPLLLTCLRVLQGIGVGGEWGGAITVAVEHAPASHRGRYAALPQLGSPTGLLLSSGAFSLVTLLPKETFDAWAWRLPFLAAFPLLVIVLLMRRRIEETPAFAEVLERSERRSVPLLDLFRDCLPEVLVGAAASMLGIGGFYLMTTFVISYGTMTLGLSSSLMLAATLVAAVVEIVVLLASGRLADRIGSGYVCALGGAVTAVVTFPVFALIDTGHPAGVIAGVVVGVACLATTYAVAGELLAGLFPAAYRYSGVGVAFNIGGVVSGFIPLAASALVVSGGGRVWPVCLLLVVVALATAAGGLLSRRLTKAGGRTGEAATA